MSIDLSRLLENTFFVEEVQNASEAIERALTTYEQEFKAGARPFEIVVPDNPDEQWVRERLVHELTYFCESEGMALPKCGGVVVAIYDGNKLYAVTAEHALRWGSEVLGMPIEQIREQYGTHEIETSLR